MLDPWFRRQYPLKHLKKAVYWRMCESRVLRDARAVLFTSEEERRLARTSFTGYAVREHVVHYGTPGPAGGDPAAARARFLTRWPALRDQRIVLFMGRIHPKKGLDLALEAFASCAPRQAGLRLVIAGPDEAGISPLDGLRAGIVIGGGLALAGGAASRLAALGAGQTATVLMAGLALAAVIDVAARIQPPPQSATSPTPPSLTGIGRGVGS